MIIKIIILLSIVTVTVIVIVLAIYSREGSETRTRTSPHFADMSTQMSVLFVQWISIDALKQIMRVHT